jgi:hypothetical protein
MRNMSGGCAIFSKGVTVWLCKFLAFSLWSLRQDAFARWSEDNPFQLSAARS